MNINGQGLRVDCVRDVYLKKVEALQAIYRRRRRRQEVVNEF
jgi:hypothetical protein